VLPEAYPRKHPKPIEQAPPGPDAAIRNYPILVRRYTRLMEIIRSVTSSLQLENIYEQVVNGAMALVECDSAVLFLQDVPNSDLRIAYAFGLDPEIYRRQMIPPSSSLAEKVLTAGNPVLVDPRNDEKKPGMFEWTGLADLNPKAILAVPLKTKGTAVGVLEAINKISGPFTPEDFSTLEALGSQAAVTIENLRLFRQSDLIAELVHEIRTPLAALATASSLLDRQDLSETQRHSVLLTFRQEVQRLDALADDYLDLARLESGRAKLQMEKFSVAALISECAEIVSPLVQAQGLRFDQELPRDPLDLVADRAKIKQVVLNLLSNAVKYNNPNGSITLRGMRCPCSGGDGQEMIAIEVSDTGRGIPTGSLPHMFERFYRVQEGTGFTRGTGLGLYIARHIVESHHGRIEVQSQVGKGTTFSIRIPALPPGRTTGQLAANQSK
jgi:signal transduction histidine kinase